MIEYYVARFDQLEELNLAQFIAHYEYSKIGLKSNRTRAIDDDEDSIEDSIDDGSVLGSDVEEVLSEELKWLRLKDELGFVKKRKAPKVLRYHSQSVNTYPDMYFYLLVMLYLPWRNEENEIGNADCAAKFEENSNIIMQNRAKFSKIYDDSIAEFIAEAEQLAAQAREIEGAAVTDDEQALQEEANPFEASGGRIDGMGNHDTTDPIQDYKIFVSSDETRLGSNEFDSERQVAEEENEVEEAATAFAE
ncbi:hypothetical protein A0J61_11925 [Choanephora cucurbitarum]|uniref:Uncharacterized protein n=1 Tax=Choanephora cucurbitarum TaxID=101091 RepID=A0A1C7LMG3_9FUNG|nr:hypothetical protein A0J61_11925 [Choanephora cucurbitarum]